MKFKSRKNEKRLIKKKSPQSKEKGANCWWSDSNEEWGNSLPCTCPHDFFPSLPLKKILSAKDMTGTGWQGWGWGEVDIYFKDLFNSEILHLTVGSFPELVPTTLNIKIYQVLRHPLHKFLI